MSHSVKKLTRKLEKLPGDLGRLKESIAYTINPNHRHDEDHEAAVDAMRTAVCEKHRFKSFGSERDLCEAKWFIDGHDYFYALSELLESAQETICIFDWWLSPELYLRRPPAENEEYRVDRLLLRKAQQGVKIFIIVYKEVTQTMSMSSSHTKHALEDLHDNICVFRHPDHLGGEITMYWSHHEKVVIVDFCVAAIGGLDICFGRWDTHNSPAADVHPTNFAGETLFPGQDYNNARVQDFTDVQRWIANQVSRLDTARMPWHDIHSMVAGPIVMDISQHFVERWNFVRELKYDHDPRYEHLAFPHNPGENDDPAEAILDHPHFRLWGDSGKKYGFHSLTPAEGGHNPFGGLGPKGNMRVQCLRSSADWSSGILTEHSIQNAYCQLIVEASHFIYIENQFFVTSTTPGQGDVQNLIGQAIVARVLSAARSRQKFKVIIVIPAIPGFSGDLVGNSATLAIIGATYRSICRGGSSIFEMIEKAGFDPSEYVSVYSLRSFDRINNDPARFRLMEKNSGISFDKAQAALGRIFLGRDATPKELKLNSHVEFTLGQEGGEMLNPGLLVNSKTKSKAPVVQIELPKTYDEALDIIRRFEAGAPVDHRIADSVAHHVLQSDGSLLDEPWVGSEESERAAYVQEELYIHSKVMIVDDRRVIIGSANLNDRSQRGDRDSEIALVIEDNEQLPSEMDGKSYIANRFAATLRRQLWRQHIGLIEPQFCPGPVTPAMRPVGVKAEDETFTWQDALVADPISDKTLALWTSTADKNTEAFDNVFHVVPCKYVEDWKQYVDYVPRHPVKPGHVWSNELRVPYIKEQLDGVRGHLVNFPLNFLKNEDLLGRGTSVNPVTMALYI